MPELASRQHVRDICGVVERALEQARRRRSTTSTRLRSRRGRASSGRCSSACRSRRRWRRRADCRWCRCTTSPATSNRSSSHNGPLPLPAVVLVVSGGHTSLYVVTEPGRYALAGPDAGRCGGGGVRQGREAAGPRVSRRSGDRSRGARRATIARSSFRRCASRTPIAATPDDPGRLDFSFSGLKTAVLRDVRGARGRPATRRRFTDARTSPTSARASSAWSSRRCSIGMFARRAPVRRRQRGHRRRRVGEQPPARRRPRARRARGPARVHPEPGAVDRQRRDDRRRRPARCTHAGVRAGWDLNAEASLRGSLTAARKYHSL